MWFSSILFIKNFMVTFYGRGSTAERLQSHYENAVYFLPLSSEKFLVPIWSTSEGWKAESTLEPPGGFEHRTIGLCCWYSMKARYVIIGTLTLLTIKNIINYFVCIGSRGIFQGSALKTVFPVLFFFK